MATGIAVAYYIHCLSYEETDNAFIDGHIVSISSRVAGHVAKVHVTDNQWVREGELIAELDPRDFQTRLAAADAALVAARAGQKSRSFGVDVTEITSTAGVNEASAAVDGANAAVETARAAVATAKSQLAQAQAQHASVQAGLKQAQADAAASEAKALRANVFLKRIEALVPLRAASQDSLDEAVAADRVAAADVSAVRQRIVSQEAAVRQAEAAISAAQSGVRQAESGVTGQLAALGRTEAQRAAAKSAPKQVAQSRSQSDVAQAEIARAEAERNQAALNLSYTKIYAPTSGHITRKSVEPGAHVQVGQPLLALVDPNLWVIANFKETQLAKMRPRTAGHRDRRLAAGRPVRRSHRQPATRQRRPLQPVAAGECYRQLREGRSARAGENRLRRPEPGDPIRARAGHVGRTDRQDRRSRLAGG